MGSNLVGQSLAHFRIEAQLGAGGMGVVYLATDEKLRRRVALKVLPDSFAKDEDRRRRFLREARSAAAVTHANIATVYEVGEANGHVFIAMELVDGETLRARIEKGLTLAESVRLAREIARGLGRAHEKGIIHRDLKPENVMLTRHDEVKILDFGLAKLREESATNPSVLGSAETEANLTQEGGVLGTPAYMSPEQIKGEAVDARTDVYSFGVMLFELLTGQRPFGGATAVAVMLAASRDAPKRASELNPLVSPELDRVVARCLEKSADARYANGEELVAALERIVLEPRGSERSSGQRGPSAETVSLLTPAASTLASSGRARWTWGLVALAGLAAVGLGLSYGARGSSSEQSARPDTSASASASAPVSSVITLANLPPPATKVPEAASEYAAGMQALHDNSWFVAMQHFERTVELDPTLAIAHLRLAMTYQATNPIRLREEFAKAAALRMQLSPRDLVLLESLEPVLQRVHGDRAEALRRLEKASSEAPRDVELLDWLGLLRGDPAAKLQPSERAIELDPLDGQAWQNKGDSLALLGRTQEARDAYVRCAAIATGSTDCIASGLATLDALEGRCDAFEADARRVFDRDLLVGSGLLGEAMFAKGRPEAAVLEVLDEGIAKQTDLSMRALGAQSIRWAFAMQAGEFARAEELARRNLAAASSSPTTRSAYDVQLGVVFQLVEPLREMGKDVEVRRVAQDFVAHGTEAWTATDTLNPSLNPSLLLLRLTVGPGGLSPEELEKRRAAWIAERLTPSGAYPGRLWIFAYAAPTLTADEARSALAALPRFAPLSSFSIAGSPDSDAYIGHTYLLAGRAEEAVTYLKRAVANCHVFSWPFVMTRAALDLGQALEATGDKPGACGAYKVVLDRWGNAKPRSVTADKAKERVKALSCPR